MVLEVLEVVLEVLGTAAAGGGGFLAPNLKVATAKMPNSKGSWYQRGRELPSYRSPFSKLKALRRALPIGCPWPPDQMGIGRSPRPCHRLRSPIGLD